ncbi:hypothetical protein [Cloacibacterium sp.]|uniref:hypothetical protein n=1 Tax=Cloacibacterium sp. TaxID=1913682 RepID=UPI0039E3D16A
MIEVHFTKIALDSLDEINTFLKYKWKQKQIDNFRNDIETFIQSLELGIINYPHYKNSKIQFALLGNKQVTTYFVKISENNYDVLLFWANKKNPQQLKKLLK